MTGWRIGWTMASPELTVGITKLQSQQTSNPCSVSQYAAITALNASQQCVEDMRIEFEKRREYVIERVNGLKDVTWVEPGGAFYAFMNVSAYFGKTLGGGVVANNACLLYTSPSPRDLSTSRMPSSA